VSSTRQQKDETIGSQIAALGEYAALTFTRGGCCLVVFFEAGGSFGGLADVVAGGVVSVGGARWSPGAGLGGFWGAGRGADLRSEAAKPSADAARGQVFGGTVSFPGAA
jgi:hypothetical protein